MKFCLVFLIVVLVFFSNISAANAQAVSKISVDSKISKRVESPKRKNKVIFSPVKKRQIVNFDIKKYLEEVNYFFYKFGFASSPVSHAIFEDGTVSEVNPNWKISKFDSSEGSDTTIVIMIYENAFELSNFEKSLASFQKNVLENPESQLELSSVEDLDMRTFKIKLNGNEPLIEFGESDVQTANLRKKFDGVILTKQLEPKLIITSISVTQNATPAGVFYGTFNIKNESPLDIVFGKNNQLQLRFENNSKFFSSGDWASQRVILSKQDGAIESGKTVEFQFKYSTPLLPGVAKEEVQLTISDKVLDKKELVIQTADNGQKVLKIRNTGIGYATIRAASTSNSEEIGRAVVGEMYIFTEQDKGYHKIKFNGKEGWVLSRYVEVVKG